MEKTIAEKIKTKYWQIEPVSDFREMLYRSAEKFGNRYAFKLKDENGKIYGVTYKQFKKDVEALGTSLIERGFIGKKIGLIGKNSYLWAISYLAISIIGIVVPIDKELLVEDVINFLNVSNSSAIIGDSKYIKNIKDRFDIVNNQKIEYIKMDSIERVDNSLNLEILLKEGEKLLEKSDIRFRDLSIEPEKLHILLFTSGTTGNAKGVELSHRNILCDIKSVYGIFKVYPTEQVLSILPIHHTYECSLGFLLVIYAGGCIAFCEGLRHITKNIKEFKPTVILCVPLLLENIHKKIEKTIEGILKKLGKEKENYYFSDLPFWAKPIVKMGVKKSLGGKMRTFIVGAAAIKPELVKDFYDMGIPAVQGYGLTECSPLVVGNSDFYHNYSAVGLPIENVEFKIENPDEQGVGEIIVKGPNVMIGYYNDPEGTAKAIQDGWFHTGDLGKVDEQGFLYITGRCKTVIVTKNGKNIYPEEIEEYLNQKLAIQECIVLGVNYDNDDETYVEAIVFPNMDFLKEKYGKEALDFSEISDEISNAISEVNKKMPNYKHIKKFHIRDTEFEKTTTKKIKRYGNNLIIN